MCYVTVVNAEVMPTVLRWHMQTLYLMCYVTMAYADVIPNVLCYDGICRRYT